MVNKEIINKTITDAISKCTRDPYKLSRKDKAFLSSFQTSDYTEDEQWDDYDSKLGWLEKKQEKSQEKVIITGNEVEELLSYSNINYEFLNERLYLDEDFREMVRKGIVDDDDLARSARILKRALNKTEGLIMNTVLHRGGRWDENCLKRIFAK